MADEQPPVLNAMAFIDGQNLYRHAMEAFGHHHPNYDPVKLHHAVCRAFGWRPTLTRFYTGVPNRADDANGAGYWSSRVIAMKRAGIHVTTRPLRYRSKQAYDKHGNLEEIKVAQEKGIDIRIALDLVSLALKQQYDAAIIFSQDQDLAEIVAEIAEIANQQQRAIKLVCAFPDSSSASSRRGIDKTEWFKMDQVFYDACLDPRDYRPKKL